jgi:hypothetical protein
MFGEHAGLGGHERGGGLGSSGGRATDYYLAQQDRDQDRAQNQDDDQTLVDQDQDQDDGVFGGDDTDNT